MKHVSRALRYLKPYWLPTLGGLIGLLLVNGANLLTPQLLRILIDQGISELEMEIIWKIAAALVGIALLRGLFNFLQMYWSEIASQGVAFDLRNTIFEKLQNLSFSYHDRAQTGKLMTRITSDVEMVRMFVGRGVVMLLSAVFMLVGTVVLLLNMNWRLALVVLSVLPLVVILFAVFISRITPISMKVQQRLAALNTILQENIAGMRVVKAFTQEFYEIERYQQENNRLKAANLDLVRLFSALFPVVFGIANLATVGVVWVGGLQVIDNQLTLGGLVAFIGYINYLLQPIFMVGMIGSMLSRAEASGERIFEVLDASSEVEEKPEAISLPPLVGKVEFNQVSFRYAGGQEDVLCEITFTANPGETIAILGQTGSGKSSIINLIPRFYDVTDGQVLIDGINVKEVTLDSLRSQIGIVLQESTLFSGTIRENIAYGRPQAALNEVIEAAKAAQADEFISQLDQGYESLVGERGVGLSGGQKQRIAIARALLIDPKILILDDSTSSVDAETEYWIQQALDRLMQDRTSFVIAQRISTVRQADQIILLDNGRLADKGTHQELLARNELYVEILETQFQLDAERVQP